MSPPDCSSDVLDKASLGQSRAWLFAAAATAGLLLAACTDAPDYTPSPHAPPPGPAPASGPSHASGPSYASGPSHAAGPPPSGEAAPASLKPWMSQQDWSTIAWDVSKAGKPLDMSQYKQLIFDDEFNTCSIGKESFRPVGHYNWYSHNGPSGGYQGKVFVNDDFQDAPDGAPFVCPGDGLLHVTAHYDNHDHTWHMGDIGTQNTSHEGFQTTYGYMEFKARMNSAAKPLRPWAALWAWSREARNSASNYNAHQFSELDIIETYLKSPTDGDQNISTYHYWPSGAPAPGQDLKQHAQKGSPTQTYPIFDDRWHVFGLAMTPHFFIVYRDGVELMRLARISEDMRQPMSPIIDSSSYFGPQGADTSKAYDVMDVDYVRVYAMSPGSED